MTKIIAMLTSVFVLGMQPGLDQNPPMTFFITSAGPGDGANLGGLEGADRHCRALADGVGADGAWRAYLSTIDEDGGAAVNARDRIGSGPWHNVKGAKIADNIRDLHGDSANLTKETILTETGDMVNGRGDDPNMHDIITGSKMDGTAFTADEYNNCNNWTSNGEGNVRAGHHDRQGGGQNPNSWNSAHNSRGCSQSALQGTGGNGYFYCFLP
jgi:hypothetical protein